MKGKTAPVVLKGRSGLCILAAILQRCLSASVTVDSQVVSSIGKGILVLAAIGPDDTPKDVESMAAKLLKMKLWPDDSDKMVSMRLKVHVLELKMATVEKKCAGN